MNKQFQTQNLTQPIKLIVVFIVSITLYAAFALIFSPTSHAATLTVNSTNDDVDNGDGDCTLREAIVAINDATASGVTAGECIAGDGNNDTIELPAETIEVTDYLESTAAPMTITGQGVGISTVSGGGNYRIFMTESDVTITDMTLTSFEGEAIFSEEGDLTLSEIEIDGSNSIVGSGDALYGFQVQRLDGLTSELTVSNVHIHGFSISANAAAGGFLLGAAQSSTVNANIDNTTIYDITNTSNAGPSATGFVAATGVIDGTFSPGDINMNVDNVTINDINTATGAAGAVGVIAAVSGGDSNVSLNITNSTFSGLRGLVNPTFGNTPTSALGFIGAALQPGDGSNITAEITNTILADSRNSQTNASSQCDYRDASSGFGGSGTGSVSITSQGGNLTDDTTCNSYFTEPSDQNNVSALADTLGSLSDNGGLVPTIPLLLGSPAIDAGVDIMGLTADARGVARPQLTAYDSGAYEVTQAELDAQATDEEADDESLAETGESKAALFLAALTFMIAGSLLLYRRLHLHKF